MKFKSYNRIFKAIFKFDFESTKRKLYNIFFINWWNNNFFHCIFPQRAICTISFNFRIKILSDGCPPISFNLCKSLFNSMLSSDTSTSTLGFIFAKLSAVNDLLFIVTFFPSKTMYCIGKSSADNSPDDNFSATECIDSPWKLPCSLKLGDTACCPKYTVSSSPPSLGVCDVVQLVAAFSYPLGSPYLIGLFPQYAYRYLPDTHPPA